MIDSATVARPHMPRMPIRWRIFGFLFAIGFVEYLQQRGLTIAADRMMPELHFSQMQIGWIEQAFVVGYALFALPGSILGQRWGARWTFLAIGVVSVLCIAATAVAPEFLSGTALFVVLVAAQLLMGAGQGPTFPVSTGVFECWFPARQWALVQGLQTMGLGLGGALAPPFIAALMTTIGWQKALWLTGLPAIPLFLWWAWYGRNSPSEHRGVSAPELAMVPQAVSEGVNSRITVAELVHVLRDRNVLLLSFSYFTMNYLYTCSATGVSSTSCSNAISRYSTVVGWRPRPRSPRASVPVSVAPWLALCSCALGAAAACG